MKNTFIVYKHTCPNGKVYIGITSQNPIKRWDRGIGYINNKHFYRAIQRYGWNSIKHEILYSELSEQEAKDVEIQLIRDYNSTNPIYGYNKTKGGDFRCKMSKETKSRMIAKLRGQKRTEEQKLHYKEAAAKRPKREHLSAKHRANISKSLIGNKRAAGNIFSRIKVAQYTLDNQFLKVFDCAKLAAKEIGCDASGINRSCRENASKEIEHTKYKGKYKGYKWYYIKEV